MARNSLWAGVCRAAVIVLTGCSTVPPGRMVIDPSFAATAEVLPVAGRPDWQGIVGPWPVRADVRFGDYRLLDLRRSAEARSASAPTLFNGNRATREAEQTVSFTLTRLRPSWAATCRRERWRIVQYERRLELDLDGARLRSEPVSGHAADRFACQLRHPNGADARMVLDAEPGRPFRGTVATGERVWTIQSEPRTEGQDRWTRTRGGWLVGADGQPIAAADTVGSGRVVLGRALDERTRDLCAAIAAALLVAEDLS